MVNYTGGKKDLRYAYLLECLHVTRHGEDAYAAILSTEDQAREHINVIKDDCGFSSEFDDCERIESKIHKIIIDVNALQPCNDTGDTKEYLNFAYNAEHKDGIAYFIKTDIYTNKEYARDVNDLL